jgi:4-phytase/acid phosphatase
MQSKSVLPGFLLLFTLSSFAQTSASKDELRAVVVLARHGVRAPIENETRSNVFNAQPWPAWPSAPGTLTPHGIAALKRMGEFYRQRYAVLHGCSSVAVESTNTPRTIGSAKAVMSVVVPDCDAPIAPDLTSDPPSIDKTKLTDAINGRMANQPDWFTHVFARPLEEMREILTKCPGCRQVPDFRNRMIETGGQSPSMMWPGAADAKVAVVNRDARKENAVALGADFAENFLLEYVEGMPMSDVGWGRIDRAKLDDLMEMNTRYHDFILRTPYYARQAAGPLAIRISHYLEQAAQGTPSHSFTYLSAHDANLTWLGGLLGMDWLVSDETFNATPPGSALVFELHHNSASNTDAVQVFFIAQTLDQIRNLTPLTGSEKPSIAPVYVPGCSGPAPQYACSVEGFVRVVSEAVQVK